MLTTPPSSAHPRLARQPRGYTLAEMIIVLALIAAALALTLPAILPAMRKAELQDAAKQVRTGLAEARSAAIGSGVPHEFRFQPGGRRWEIVPRLSSQNGPTGQLSPQRDGPPLFGPEPLSGSGPWPVDAAEEPWSDAPQGVCLAQEQLPGGVVFAPPWSDEAGPAATEASTVIGAAEQDAESWWTPIVFYPSGRASNECIRLFGQDDRYVDVLLRGLTGTATINEPASPAEAAPETPATAATERSLP